MNPRLNITATEENKTTVTNEAGVGRSVTFECGVEITKTGLSGAFAQQREIFHNPVIEADVPDPSMIRVGNYYYLVSTTMHLMPGCPVMRSKDLVHWETISYVFQRLTD